MRVSSSTAEYSNDAACPGHILLASVNQPFLKQSRFAFDIVFNSSVLILGYIVALGPNKVPLMTFHRLVHGHSRDVCGCFASHVGCASVTRHRWKLRSSGDDT